MAIELNIWQPARLLFGRHHTLVKYTRLPSGNYRSEIYYDGIHPAYFDNKKAAEKKAEELNAARL